jgi:hypothetical protein
MEDFLQKKDPMYVVGHDYKYIQGCVGGMLWNLFPDPLED